MPQIDLSSRLIVGLDGPSLGRDELAWLESYRPAGVILFARNVASRSQLERLCTDLRSNLPADAEIVADHEGGPISVLARALGRPPAPFGLGQLADPDLTFRVHRQTGQLLGECGLHRVLAPCADVLVEMSNPVIGARSFGFASDLVVEHVAAAVTGLSAAGIGCCLKHWPGHGGTRADSHDGPADCGDGAVAEPFAAGIDAGADAVMVGHLQGGISGAERRVATLDAAALTAARGLAPGTPLLLYTDDVTMGALRPDMSADGVPLAGVAESGLLDPAKLPLSWFAALADAGCDRWLCRGIPWEAFPLPSVSDSDPQGDRDREAGLSRNMPANTADGWASYGSQSTSLPSYAEARHRLAGQQGSLPALPRKARLCWLDGTPGDSWGEADLLEPLLMNHCQAVLRLSRHGADLPAAHHSALLLTSHRPLSGHLLTILQRKGFLADRGACLVMGHPSLGPVLKDLLPRGWKLNILYDIQREDLAAALPPSA